MANATSDDDVVPRLQPNESEEWFDRYVREHSHEPGPPEPDLGTSRRPDRAIEWAEHRVSNSLDAVSRALAALIRDRRDGARAEQTLHYEDAMR
jgi:hypothetical protein